MNSKFKHLLSLLLLALFFGAQLALVVNVPTAQALKAGSVEQVGFDDQEIPKTFAGSPNRAEGNIYFIIQDVINMALALLGVIFLIILLWGGFRYMTAGGDEGKVKEAITQIKNGVIGTIIVLMSWSVTRFVMNALVNATTDSF